MARTIYRLCADHGCFPLWERVGDDYENRNPATLPLSPELLRRLARWATQFEATADLGHPSLSGFANELEALAFDSEGRALAEALERELEDSSVEYLLRGRVAPNL